MLKLIGCLLGSLFCLAFALIPEGAMYFLYSFIAPQSELAKIAMFAIFWFGGIGLCILFAVIAFAVWIQLMKELL